MKRNDNFTNENDINDHNNPIKGYEFSIMNIRANSKPEMKRAFDFIGRIFLDTEENNYYKICNVVKISGDSSVHGVRFFRFYNIALWNTGPPTDINDFEHQDINQIIDHNETYNFDFANTQSMISSACPNISPTVSSPINQNSIKVNLLRDNIDLYNVDTRLIDIKPENFGIFVGISPSFNLIPSSYLKHTRDLFTQAFRHCLSSTSSSIDWIKLMLLPIILFTSNDKKKLRRNIIRKS